MDLHLLKSVRKRVINLSIYLYKSFCTKTFHKNLRFNNKHQISKTKEINLNSYEFSCTFLIISNKNITLNTKQLLQLFLDF